VYSRWCPLLWINRWRKRKVIALATKKKLWLRLYGIFIVRSTFKNQLVYQSFSNQVLGCRSSISWSSRSRSSHVRSIHPVPDLHRVYALKIRDHSPPTVAGAYHLWCDHFLVPLCDEKRIHWYPWRTNISIIPRFMISSIGMDSPPLPSFMPPHALFPKIVEYKSQPNHMRSHSVRVGLEEKNHSWQIHRHKYHISDPPIPGRKYSRHWVPPNGWFVNWRNHERVIESDWKLRIPICGNLYLSICNSERGHGLTGTPSVYHCPTRQPYSPLKFRVWP